MNKNKIPSGIQIKFLIIPNTGVIVAKNELSISHKQILQNMDMNDEQINKIIETCPRGYYADNTIVLYQTNNLQPGTNLELKKESYDIVKDFYSDLKRIFSLNSKTEFYGGLLISGPGTPWKKINQFNVSVNEFEKGLKKITDNVINQKIK